LKSDISIRYYSLIGLPKPERELPKTANYQKGVKTGTGSAVPVHKKRWGAD
jgi:hypothetical protein